MSNLRNWNGDSIIAISETLAKFGLNPNTVLLQKYESLTPDSMIWYFRIDNNNYCLYAEDYVPSLEHVLKAMETHTTEWFSNDRYELMEVDEVSDWEQSSPVRSATTYQPPKDTKEFMKYAFPVGHDFVFLGKSTN